MEDYPRTLDEFERRFASAAACRAYLVQLRWRNGFHCPKCGGAKAWPVGLRFECAGCGRQTSVTAGTIFQDTRTPLPTWFRAMWWVASQKTDASAVGLQQVLGFGSYETAWTWLHKLRRAMVRPGRDRLTGRVEVDEAFIGGVEEGVRGRQTVTKALIAVACEEDGEGIGRIRMRRIPDATADSLQAFILSATALPVGSTSTALADDAATTALATLGYPGFAYRRPRQRLNPAEVLLRSLKTANLDARVVEALVWVALTYANLDWDWLVRQGKLEDLQNRLGFLVTLARQLAEQRDNAEVVARLTRAEEALEYSRLQREDAFRVSMTEAERRWLREHRSPEATHWNVLTNLTASELARGF